MRAFAEIATLSRRYALERAPGEMTSNEMAKMARLFSASDTSAATWPLFSRRHAADSAVTQRAGRGTLSVRLVAGNALLAEKCQPHSARAVGAH